MTEKPERSVLYAVYELLSLEFQSRFFTLTARIWHEHCTNIPKNKERQKEAYREFAREQRSILNGLLEQAWGLT